MNDNNSIIDITRDVKRAERKARWAARWNAAKEWAQDNAQVLAVAVPTTIGAIGGAIKIFGRRHNLRVEERNKDLRCYDTSLGHYWELKRKLSNEEWVYIDRQRKEGERLSDILDRLKVLK